MAQMPAGLAMPPGGGAAGGGAPGIFPGAGAAALNPVPHAKRGKKHHGRGRKKIAGGHRGGKRRKG